MLQYVVTYNGRIELGNRVQDIDSSFHDNAIFAGQHAFQCCHEPKATQYEVEVGSVFELQGERVRAGLLKEVGQFSESRFLYRIVS